MRPQPVRLDYPDFLHDELVRSLGADFEPVLRAMQARAPVDLRVNILKTNASAATVVLARDGVQVAPHPLGAARAQGAGEPAPGGREPRLYPRHGRAAGRREPARRRDQRGAPGHDGARLLRRRRRQDAGARRGDAGAGPAAGVGRQSPPHGRPARPRPPRRGAGRGSRRRASAPRSGRSATWCWWTRRARAPAPGGASPRASGA